MIVVSYIKKGRLAHFYGGSVFVTVTAETVCHCPSLTQSLSLLLIIPSSEYARIGVKRAFVH